MFTDVRILLSHALAINIPFKDLTNLIYYAFTDVGILLSHVLGINIHIEDLTNLLFVQAIVL